MRFSIRIRRQPGHSPSPSSSSSRSDSCFSNRSSENTTPSPPPSPSRFDKIKALGRRLSAPFATPPPKPSHGEPRSKFSDWTASSCVSVEAGAGSNSRVGPSPSTSDFRILSAVRAVSESSVSYEEGVNKRAYTALYMMASEYVPVSIIITITHRDLQLSRSASSSRRSNAAKVRQVLPYHRR